MVCTVNKIDSNVTGLAYAEEECIKELPETAVWYDLEPNSYSDLGGELTTVARSPIDPSRQNKKGTVTDLDASGGFNVDFTQTNLNRLLQGFFFADARQGASTAPLNAAAVVITAVAATDDSYAAASGLAVFGAGQLIKASGFTNAANNGLKTVVSAAAGKVTVSQALIDETPPAGAKLESVGFQFPSADVAIAVTDGLPSLVATATNMTTLGLIPGQWIYLGGDATANTFANNAGFARIKTITATAIIFDDVSFIPETEAGTGKTIQFFTGIVIKNEKDRTLIKRRTYNIERTLGENEEGNTQAEYLEGAICNELTLNIPTADKINMDLTFIACDNTYRTGLTGDEVKPGVHIPAPGEDAFNTSSDIKRIKLSVHDETSANPAALFGYASEATVTINNNASPNKAISILGAFDVSVGNFDVGGSITCYFTTVSAVKAVRENADVGLSYIGAYKNAGFVFDIPLLGLGNGRLNVEKDQPITLPLDVAAAENKHGYTMLYQSFPYLPNVAMAD